MAAQSHRSNLPPFCFRRCWITYSSLLPTFHRPGQCIRVKTIIVAAVCRTAKKTNALCSARRAENLTTAPAAKCHATPLHSIHEQWRKSNVIAVKIPPSSGSVIGSGVRILPAFASISDRYRLAISNGEVNVFLLGVPAQVDDNSRLQAAEFVDGGRQQRSV